MNTEIYTEPFKKIVLAVLLAVLLVLVINNTASAADVGIQQTPLGSGTPGTAGVTPSTLVMDGMYHAPQYMPGYPTAATLWPRVVDVECTEVGKQLNCASYNWLPELGRGEYLLFRPRIAVPPVPTERIVEVPVVVYKEVPAKHGKE